MNEYKGGQSFDMLSEDLCKIDARFLHISNLIGNIKFYTDGVGTKTCFNEQVSFSSFYTVQA